MQPVDSTKRRKIGFLRPSFWKRNKKSKQNHRMDQKEEKININAIKKMIEEDNSIIFELGCGEQVGITDREFIKLGAQPRKRSRIIKEARILINCEKESIQSALNGLNLNQKTTND